MIKQDWMVIVAGEVLVDAISTEQMAKCSKNASGYYNSQDLCAFQVEQFRKGIEGVEIVKSLYGYSVRYDSGLQNFGLLASSRNGDIDGSLEAAVEWVKNWVARKPECRYSWYRK